MNHSHLPTLSIKPSALHPIVRVIVEAGGGAFRVAPVSGYPHGLPLLCDNALYPFSLWLVESSEGLPPARKNERGEFVPVLLLAECRAYLPMLERAHQRAICQPRAA